MKYLSKHITLFLFGWRIVIYGFNAMHVAVRISTRKWGYICFHPPMKCFGKWWPWYFYLSPNATSWAATFAIGPGIEWSEKTLSKIHRSMFGHNFDIDTHYDQMQEIKEAVHIWLWETSKRLHVLKCGEL